MSNEFVTFSNDALKAGIRGVVVNGDPWFVAKDICGILDIRTDKVRAMVDSDEITTISAKIANTPNQGIGLNGGFDGDEATVPEGSSLPISDGQEQNDIIDVSNGGKSPLLLSESGVYHLIFMSKRPVAKAFRRWVTEKVLPELRKTGSVALNADTTGLSKQLEYVTERLVQTTRELAIANYKYGLATAKLHVLTNLPAPKDVLIDPKKYSSASDVFMNVAGYYMRKDNDKGDSIIKLGMLLYNTSIAKGYPIALSRREFVFHKDIVDECVAALKAKAGPRDIDLAFRPGARKKAGVSGLNMSSILMDYSDEEVEEAVDNPSDDDDLTFDI